MTRSEHRWVVDGIEEGVARIEEDGAKMIAVPVNLLPPDVKEGQLLRVVLERPPATRSAKKGGATPVPVIHSIEVDSAATEKALRNSAAVMQHAMEESRKRDPGGDVAL